MKHLKKTDRAIGVSFYIALTASLITACSPTTPTAATTAANAIANNSLGDNYKGPPTPCDGELSTKDAADLVNGSVSVNHYSMLGSMPGEGCELGEGQAFSAFIDIAMKKSAQQFYANMLQMNPKRTALPGVGDDAVSFGTVESNIPDAKEINIMARKGDWICQAELIHKNGPGRR